MHKLKSFTHAAARRFLGLFGFLFVLSLLLTDTAAAQVVQPSYVRPSKGAPIVLATVTATSTMATYTTSAIFDWSAFAGVVVTANVTAGPTGTFTSCRYGARIRALGGTSTNPVDFFGLNVANNDYKTSTSQSWYVRVLPGYLRFTIGTYEAAASGQPSCTYKITATPLPFDYSGQLASTNAFSTFSEGSDPFYVSGNYSVIRIQNLDTVALFCYIRGPDGYFPPTGRTAFRLFPASAGSADSDGGVIELRGFVGDIKCVGGDYTVFGY